MESFGCYELFNNFVDIRYIINRKITDTNEYLNFVKTSRWTRFLNFGPLKIDLLKKKKTENDSKNSIK